jgi:hypothetical protein
VGVQSGLSSGQELMNIGTLVEGACVGSGARAVYGASEIGTAYSPPKRGPGVSSGGIPSSSMVETVLDVGHREEVCTSSLQPQFARF